MSLLDDARRLAVEGLEHDHPCGGCSAALYQGEPHTADCPYVATLPQGVAALEAAERMPLREWRCTGRRRDGRQCKQVLAEYATDGRIALRKRCDKCGTWNTTER